ncbi:HU family DNA-binding protein [Sphingomonas sp. AP4-R1]|uniref:HU family DNA-binding protein n=1 Tax=Sphingomonas sp. AP4-R1 TaxID=2735134 RepID=UPI0014933009|nr:HU family DNA-binding protein [Sphingomonas sp. AP4-R1]QJU58357.1 HU family DNA-binding protein [Sphingomonas sp. AP4-R1]
MNKQELIKEIAHDTGIDRNEAKRILETCLHKIADSLRQGEEVRFVGFGSFSVATRKPSAGRNPRSGEPIEIGAVARPRFRPGKLLKHMVTRDGSTA